VCRGPRAAGRGHRVGDHRLHHPRRSTTPPAQREPRGRRHALQALDGPRAADNRDRWESWLPAFTNELGPDHPDTLTTRNTLARWRGEAGDPAGAATATEQLLTDRLRVLGPDHPDTLSTRHNLASWRGHAGDPAGAATATEQLLTDCLRVLGPDHPNTLTTRNNLARWRAVAGHPASATSESRSVP
jgi:hypothetical protein